MPMKYFDNLRRYFRSKRCFIGSESRAISRQQTIRRPDNSDNNGRWHFLGIIDRCEDDQDDCKDHDDLSRSKINTYQFHIFAFACGEEWKKVDIWRTVVIEIIIIIFIITQSPLSAPTPTPRRNM